MGKDTVTSPCIDALLPSLITLTSLKIMEIGSILEDTETQSMHLSGTGPGDNQQNPASQESVILTVSDNRLRENSPETVLHDTSFIDVGGLGTRQIQRFNIF